MARNRSFQGLRALFAFGVVLSHMTFLGENTSTASLFDNYVSHFANVGFFFMLSGFFMLATFDPKVSYGKFLLKKLKRFYPLHLVLLIILMFPSLIRGKLFANYDILSILANVFLIQSFFKGDAIIFINPVAWYLSSLFVCFIVGYWVVKLVKKNSKAGKILLFVLAAVLLMFKVVMALVLPYDGVFGLSYHLIYRCPLAGLSDFFLGMIVFMLAEKIDVKNPLPLQIVAIVLTMGMFLTKRYLPSNVVTGFYSVPFNMLIIFAFNKETAFSSAVFGNRVAKWLGDISFEIYMVHMLIIMYALSMCERLSINHYLIVVLLTIVGTVVASFIFNKLHRLVFSGKNNA